MSTSPIPYRSGNLLDDQVNTELIRVCKSALPYLDRGMQKNLAISLKLLEVISVIQLYNSDTTTLEPDLSMMRGENWENRFLSDVRNSLNPDKTYIIDALMKLNEVRNIMGKMERKAPTEAEPEQNFTDPPIDPVDSPPPPTSGGSPFNFANFFNNMAGSQTSSNPFPNPFASSSPNSSSNTSSNTSSGPNPMDMINAFAPFLDDKQRQMINLISAFMKPNNNA